MGTHTIDLQDWKQPRKYDPLTEWIKVAGMLVGIGAIPQLVLVHWLVNWYWAVGLAAGLLVLGTGLYHWFRSRQLARTSDTDPQQVLVDAQLLWHGIRVTTRRKPQEGVGSPLPTDKTATRQVTPLILLGVFILLPATAGLLLNTAGVADNHRVVATLGTPALMLWVTFESFGFYSHWQRRASGKTAILGMVRSGALVLAAVLIWITLGLAGDDKWAKGLFWAGLGFAVMGALVGFITHLIRRKHSTPPEESTTKASQTESTTRDNTLGSVQVTEEGSGAREPDRPLGNQNEVEPGDEKLVMKSRAVFQIFKGKNNQYYFRLRAANGEIILSSEGYLAKSSCQKGIESVRKNAPLPERYKQGETRKGQYYFVLRAANHRVIGVSESYTTRAGCEIGIEAVQRVVPKARVTEVE